ncbi:heme biosynthesis protein HemY [Cognatiluteimonas weifangensis]|uniref:Heme biosynthesis protein HemY n=1 Tax=Cognatiluteimonas weifangensis TaxID=2303539 RepID=A0A372DPS1_9GAMM|nr:heme biosynthesis HemY N-terminal domain-containing protein [Luteimonas weifangensis]RFP61494.1 heme biosynthesis protein HemY [Luteimonas weifangensis]
MGLFRNLLFWIVLALLGALLAQLLLADPGYVLVRFRGSDYTTTVAAGLLLLLAAAAAAWLLWRLLTLPFRSWRTHRDRRGRARLGEGLEALHQGHYARAEKLLAQAADGTDGDAVARLAAARAAAARGDHAAARAQLQALGERHAASRAIAAAELALAEQHPTDALVALDAPAAQPLPPRGLALRAQILADSGQAAQAYGLLGALRQQQALPAAQLDALQAQWAEAALRQAGDANALAERWETLPKPLRSEPAVVDAYAQRAAALRWDEAATRSLEQALDTRWDETLAARYGSLDVGRLEARRAQAERWLPAHPASPALLLTLARLARAQGQWPQAENYLHRAIAQGAGGEAWEELGHGFADNGEEALARQCYANALRVARDEPPVALPVRDLRQQIQDHAAIEERDEHGLPRLRG